ncbi:hypothetical protein J3R82DRAFT_2793 [Butyriboletus roseoflavus]|nr:hypothetical protein J3R82DRAFT_2793 [Butyriboletus roseoflavus]
MAFAVKCAESVLSWMGLTVSTAKNFVDSHGPYYSGGDEEVEIPALLDGADDPIFPAIDGAM